MSVNRIDSKPDGNSVIVASDRASLAGSRQQSDFVLENQPSHPSHAMQKPNSSRPRFLSRMTTRHRIYGMNLPKVYPLHVARPEKKGRAQTGVDETISGCPDMTERQWVNTL